MALRAECKSFSGLYRPTGGLRKYIYSNISATFKNLLNPARLETSTEKLDRMLMIYNEKKQAKSVVNTFGTEEEQVVYYLLEKCFIWEIEDSALVEKILFNVYEKVGHFSELYRFLMWRSTFGTADVDLLEKSLSIFIQEMSNETDMISYFLHHATLRKLMFKGVRFIDLSVFIPSVTPCVFSIMEARPKLLLLLLRYGAILETDGSLGTVSLIQVFRHLLGTLWNTLKDATEEKVRGTEPNVKEKLFCARYLLRAVPRLKYRCLNGMLIGINGCPDKTRLTDATEYVRHLNDRGFVPLLRNRYFEPSELQHLCRCKIRKQLWSNWSLPYGIQNLPIHSSLKDYIDLMSD